MSATGVATRLPAGAVELTVAHLDRAGRALATLSDRPTTTAGPGIAAALLVTPLIVAELGGLEVPAPRPPYRIGTGAVAAELGADGDAGLFEDLLATLGAQARESPERVSAAAQEWRLPVLPYRRLVTGPRRTGPAPVSASVARSGRPADLDLSARPLRGLLVCDLSAMWAAPLATWCLAAMGAEVVKVESRRHRDGVRGWGGSDTYFETLNHAKTILDLDLTTADGHRDVATLIRDADLLVESYSSRVMGNLGLGPEQRRALNPRLITAAVRAVRPGVDPDWIGYGSSVHAMSGLGDDRTGGFRETAVAYPDPLAGVQLLAEVLEALALRRGGDAYPHELGVSLRGAIEPLRRHPDAATGSLIDASALAHDRELWETGLFVDPRDGRGLFGGPPLGVATPRSGW